MLLALGCGRDHPLLGVWGGKSLHGDDLRLIFGREGKLSVTFVKSKQTNPGRFWLDDSRTPHLFDYQIEGRGRIRTILEFVDKDTIAFEEIGSSSDPRPERFGRGRLVFRRK